MICAVAPIVSRFLCSTLATHSHPFPSRVSSAPGRDQGLFATTALAVGTTVERFAGPTVLWRDVPVSEVCHAILLEGEEWMVPTTAARFINHSCAPNCTVDDTLAVITLRAIADYLRAEGASVDEYAAGIGEHVPYRQELTP